MSDDGKKYLCHHLALFRDGYPLPSATHQMVRLAFLKQKHTAKLAHISELMCKKNPIRFGSYIS
jgi:hypothetical protein